MNPKIFLINSVNYGSTGTITKDIAQLARNNNFDTYFAFAASRSNRKNAKDKYIEIGSILERNIHLKLAYYSGYNDYFSFIGTQKLIKKIDEIKPDIIHIHNLHNCYINLKLLLNYIKESKIPIVWTLHDCWAFTGKCPHFTMVNCYKWKTGCYECPQYKQYPATRIDKTKEMYELKKNLFSGVKNLTIVTPSEWLKSQVEKSFLSNYPIKVINNGIDLSVFKPSESDFRSRFNLKGKTILLGVANPWSNSKGLNMFIQLSRMIDDNYKIVLVGLSIEQIEKLPSNIIGIQKTNSQKELAEIYTIADYFINPSLEETMGLVTVEALACGTPVIVSNSTAVPEMITSNCGIVVNENTTENYYETLVNLKRKFSKEDCISWASNFDINIKFDEYINIYQSVNRNPSNV